jgi:hypothetical protein
LNICGCGAGGNRQIDEPSVCTEPVTTFAVNFSYLQYYEDNNFVYTYDMINANIIETCNSIKFDLYDDYYNPTGLYMIFSHWLDSDLTLLDYISLSTGDILYDAGINGTFETFTQITASIYRLVPIRCSNSFPVTLNFSQIEVYDNSLLVHTQNTSTLTAKEECGIIYIRGFDTNSAGIEGFNLYWDAGQTSITDTWIYAAPWQIQSGITGPNVSILPDDFTSITDGNFQLVPVRP